MAETKMVPAEEVSKHNKPGDCWIVVQDKIWDVTDFAPEHPGGAAIILRYAGRDATEAYLEVHSMSVIKDNLAQDSLKGTLDPSTITKEWRLSTSSSTSVKATAQESEKPPLNSIINSEDFEKAASLSAPKKAFAFYSTADTDCWTRSMNTEFLRKIWFRPRVMRDVTDVDTSSTILGNPVSLPLFICPTGLAKLINPEAEKALARGAQSTGIMEIISCNSSHPIEDIVAQAPEYPFAFQLYLNKKRERSKEALQKAEQLGIKAVFVTVDAAGRGKRESDERLKADNDIINPVTGEQAKAEKRGNGLTRLMGSYIDQGMTWEDLNWIRSVTKLPIILKGIGCAEDAKIAMQYKVDGLLLGNHGGRNLDYSPPSILILLEMHKLCPEIFNQMEIYIDGGFRRGADIIKALCLGAKAVGIGRTFLYALHYGVEGIEHLVQILKDEMESVMKLIGIKDLSEVHPALVNTADIDHLVPSSTSHPYIKWKPSARVQRL